MVNMQVHSGYAEKNVHREHCGITLSSPTARVVSITELLENIFQLVDINPTRKKTLLSLALTCKSFTGMALDLLWKNLDSFTPLIRCFPTSLWKPDEFEDSELELLRAMTFDDWSVFCKYNHRVHSLHMRSAPCGRLSTETWGVIGCPPFSLPLLPNLISLTWHVPDVAFSYIRLFATPKLTSLDVYAFDFDLGYGPSFQSILWSIPIQCPSVSEFRFHTFRGSSSMDAMDASAALQRWSHLIFVVAGRISDAAILHLSNLPSLRELRLELHPTPIDTNTQKRLQRPVFRALQKLWITCETLEPLNAFFTMSPIAPKLLSFSIDSVHSADALPASISHLSNVCAHSALECLRVNLIDCMDNYDVSISGEIFQPLCAFRNLREFTFSWNRHVELDDTLLQMAKAWPLLEELAIYGEWSNDDPSSITVDSFVSLLQHCPHLASVSIAVDWSAVDRRDMSLEIPYEGFAHKTLSRADFGSSTVRYTETVAAFISAIAPKLETIVGWCSGDHDLDDPECGKYHSRWNTVCDLVKKFSMIREQGGE